MTSESMTETYLVSWRTNGSGIQVTLRVLLTAWEIFVYIIKINPGGMITLLDFMKNGSGVQTILKPYLSSLIGCNNGITDIRGLRIALIWWVANDKHRDFHGNWYRRSSNFKVLLRKLERLILVLLMGAFVIYVVEMGPSDMIYVSSC
jgi:hypothetical protein